MFPPDLAKERMDVLLDVAFLDHEVICKFNPSAVFLELYFFTIVLYSIKYH
jgi:hypothetical protein